MTDYTVQVMELIDFIDTKTNAISGTPEWISDMADLDTYLSQYDLPNTPSTILVSLLRCTFSIRLHLKIYPDLIRNVYEILTERGEDADKILRGLDPKSYFPRNRT